MFLSLSPGTLFFPIQISSTFILFQPNKGIKWMCNQKFKKKNPGEIKVKLYYSIYEMIDPVDLHN